ncbi:MAG: hypothetical protein K9H26_14935 [Prolixibacteraceae bacterium]|nr:hypothetical protein [Prolixibacteraceae bacterium]
MKYSTRNIPALLTILIVFPLLLSGQNNTSSPYSKFGIGDLASIGYGRNLALGGTGLALRDPYHINLKNPASLTAIDSMNFLFETGVNIMNTNSSSVDYEENYWDGNLTHIALAHRYSQHVMASYGVMPYSNIGYRLRTMKSLEGEDSFVLTDWVGSGGINKIFYSLGFKFSDKFSLGTEFGYYYGPLIERRKTWAMVQTENPTLYYSNSRYHGVSVKGAFQYNTPLGEKGSQLLLGGYFTPGQKIWGESDVLIRQQYGTTIIDTVYLSQEKAKSIYVPISFGAGLGVTLNGKYLLTADYEMAFWDAVNSDKAYLNQSVYSLGFEVMPQNDLNYFKRCAYRLGFHYDSGYIQTKGYRIDDFRVSAGIGLPVMKSASMLNLTLEAGQRGTISSGLIRERYIKMTVAFSFQDFWFVPRRLN